jgi:hypothetical protein
LFFTSCRGYLPEVLSVYGSNIDSTEEPFKGIEEGLKVVRASLNVMEGNVQDINLQANILPNDVRSVSLKDFVSFI